MVEEEKEPPRKLASGPGEPGMTGTPAKELLAPLRSPNTRGACIEVAAHEARAPGKPTADGAMSSPLGGTEVVSTDVGIAFAAFCDA